MPHDLDDALAMPTGWIPSPVAEVQTFLRKNGTFGSTPAFGKTDGDTSDVFLWNCCRKVLDENLPTHFQQHNDCVSHAFGTGLEYLQCAAIALGKARDLQFNFVSSEAIYGLARVQNGQLLPGCLREGGGQGGGTMPTHALSALSRYGILPRDQHGTFDLRLYNADLALRFGNQGLPASLEAIARAHPLKSGKQTAVRSFDEAAAALRAGYPVVVCSHVGFSRKRDKEGFCSRSSSSPMTGGHAMLFIGVRGRSGLCCLNSWGDDYFSGPTPDGMPAGAFWVHAQDVETMLREGESYIVSVFDGFPALAFDF